MVLHSLRYHLPGMDLGRLTPLGLKGPPMGARGGGGAPIEAAQSSSHGVAGAAAHSLSHASPSPPPNATTLARLSFTRTEKTSVIKCNCDVLIKKY